MATKHISILDASRHIETRPGPYSFLDRKDFFTIRDGRGDVVCAVVNHDPVDGPTTKLLAAAPQMLDALRLVALYAITPSNQLDPLSPAFNRERADELRHLWDDVYDAIDAATTYARAEPEEDGSDDGRCTRHYPSLEGEGE